jgi:hypothetical protein
MRLTLLHAALPFAHACCHADRAQVLQRVPHAMFEGAVARVEQRSVVLSLEEYAEYEARSPLSHMLQHLSACMCRRPCLRKHASPGTGCPGSCLSMRWHPGLLAGMGTI